MSPFNQTQVRQHQSHPARLISTQTGLWLEWAGRFRARLSETQAFELDYLAMRQIQLDLIHSTWVAPPSLRLPAHIKFAENRPPPGDLEFNEFQRIWRHAVTQRYGQHNLKLALRIFPHGFSLLDLSRVKAHTQKLEKLLFERPALGPLLGFDLSLWAGLDNWRPVKNRMLALGMRPLTWRWLNHAAPAYLASIDWRQPRQIAWVNLHAATGRKIPARLLDRQTGAIIGMAALGHWLMGHHDSLDCWPAHQVVRVVRMVVDRLLAIKEKSHLEEIVREEIPLITDWLLARVAGEASNTEHITRSWTYDTLIDRQTHWHIHDLRFEDSKQNVFWQERLGQGVLPSGIRYFELASLHALLMEARKMHHCVPSYIERCIAGEICLFHLVSTGAKSERATLELARQGASGWRVAQLKGPCNVRASHVMESAAKQLVNLLEGGYAAFE